MEADTFTLTDPRAFQRLLESLPIISYVIVLDDARRTIQTKYVSPQVEAILGYSPEEWKSDPRFWIDHIHPDDRSYVAEAVERANQSDRPLTGLEYRFLTSTGRIRWFRTDQIVRRVSDEGSRIHGVMVDITAEKTAERALSAREHQMRTIFDNANDIIARYDRDHRHQFVNQAVQRITSLPAQEHIGKTLRELAWDPDLVDLWEAALTEAFESGADQSIEFSIEGPQGTHWYHTRLVPESSPAGSIQTVLAITHDISAVIEAQSALRDSEKKLQLIIDHAPEAIVLYDFDQGHFIEVNNNAVEMFGYSQEQLLQMSPLDLSPENQPDGRDSAEFALRVMRKALGGEGQLFDWTYLDRDGNEILSEIRLIRFPDAERRILRGSILDISDRVQAEAQKKSTEEHYRQLFESMPIGLYRTSPEGEILEVNQEMVRLLGYPDVDMLRTRTSGEVQVHSQDRDKWRAAVEAAENYHVQETRLVRYDGSHVTVREISRAVRGPSGEILYYEGSMEDITERKTALERLRQSEERYRSLFEGVPIGLYRTDPGGRILDLNETLVRMLGYPEKTPLIGMTATELFGSAAESQRWLHDLQVHGQIRNREIQVLRAGNEPIWVRSNARIVRNKRGAILHIEASLEDITESIHAREEIARLAAFPTENPDPILACDPGGNLTYSNPSAQTMLHRFGLEDLYDLLPKDHQVLVRDAFAGDGRVKSGERTIEERVLRWLYYSQPDAQELHIYGQDVTDQKEAEARLIHDAFHDALTGLANRSLFLDRLEHAVQRARRHAHYQFAVLFLDLDRFKLVNDSLGHLVGDQLLQSVGQRLRDCVRAVDTVARLGGDEFGVLLEEIHGSVDATRVANRIHRALSRAFNVGEHEIFSSASIGIALNAESYSAGEEVIRDADIAMYRAKAARSKYVIFDQSMHAQAVEALKLENELRQALSKGEFFLEFQPVFTIPGQHVAGFEALLRWHHPQRGILLPDDFTDSAQDSHLLGQITDWSVEAACKNALAWGETYGSEESPYVSVNIENAQSLTSELCGTIAGVLKSTGLKPDRLVLEISEQVLIETAASNQDLLRCMDELGVQLHVDSFGAGYSSLRFLHILPIAALKFDCRLSPDLDDKPLDVEIIRSVRSLASSLEKDLIAEGVETEHQLHKLASLGIRWAQGDYLKKPLAAEAVIKYLAG